jgi:DNA-binding winged helix-turn-helix (wHTH) protein
MWNGNVYIKIEVDRNKNLEPSRVKYLKFTLHYFLGKAVNKNDTVTKVWKSIHINKNKGRSR